MYKNKKIVAFIPARKGSKRLKNKNLLKINGLHLFQHSIEIAKKSKYIDDIIVSTDSAEILKLAHQSGCVANELRPDYLSDDNSRIIDAMLYELNMLNNKYDAIVLLQPTYPYRTTEMLDQAIVKYFEEEKSLVTVIKCKTQPEFIRTINNGKLLKIINDSTDIRGQDFKDYYLVVGSIYINNINKLNNKLVLNENSTPFIIEEKFAIDIDTKEEFDQIKIIMESENA